MAYFHTNVLDNAIKAMPTVGTASGSVASFDTDMTENLVSCVCQLPYNSNGYNNITINHNSINLWNEQWVHKKGYSTGTTLNSPSNLASADYIMVTGGTTIYVKIPSTLQIYLYQYDDTQTFLMANRINSSATFTLGATTKYIMFASLNDEYSGDYQGDISINYPGIETGYNPFKGVYTDFPSVVYGGTFEAISGTLISEYESDGTEKVTPDIIRCNGGQIVTLDNETNTIYNDCGDTEVKFLLTVGKAIS